MLKGRGGGIRSRERERERERKRDGKSHLLNFIKRRGYEEMRYLQKCEKKSEHVISPADE